MMQKGEEIALCTCAEPPLKGNFFSRVLGPAACSSHAIHSSHMLHQLSTSAAPSRRDTPTRPIRSSLRLPWRPCGCYACPLHPLHPVHPPHPHQVFADQLCNFISCQSTTPACVCVWVGREGDLCCCCSGKTQIQSHDKHCPSSLYYDTLSVTIND